MAEQLLQSGNLVDSAFLGLLMAAHRAPSPVILHIARSEAQVRSLWFRQGRVVGFDTSYSGEGLGAMLVKRGKLQPETAQDVRRSSESEGTTDAAIIQRLRLLSAPVLNREMSLWATLLLVQTFSWEVGTFRLVSENSADRIAIGVVEVNLPVAMKSGVFRRITVGRARADLASIAQSSPILAVEPPFALDSFGLSKEQLAFAESLDGCRTMEEILADAPLGDDDSARTLYLLHHSESVRLDAEDEDDVDIGDMLDEFGSGEDGFGAVAPDSRPPLVPAHGGIDFSQISFGASSGRPRSKTTHASTSHAKEEVAATHGRAQVRVVTGSVAPGEDEDLAESSSSMPGLGSDLFAGIGGGAESSARSGGKPRRRPAPSPKGPAIDAPPTGASFTIEAGEWSRLTTKEKRRIKELVARLGEMETQNYFEWLDVPPEAPMISVKKAYFKLAQRFHPDKMLDEGAVYASLAEVLFTKISEAYETLGEEESSQTYVKKHIHGEKDENDLAMEQVQRILKAEGDFKRGQRMLHAGKLIGALGAFEAAMDGYPEEGEYVAYHGFVLFRVKQKSDPLEAARAIELIRKGMEMAPASATPPHLLGKAYLAMGDGDAAKAALRASLKMNADNPEAVRDYKRADAMTKGEEPGAAGRKSGLKGLFRRFKKSE
jgi:hypothetical protein